MTKKTIEDTIHTLRERLQQPLPGWSAQSRMATEVHRKARALPRTDARRAGVLILLFPRAQQLHLPLILRTVYYGVHSGQVALPGGKVEAQDRDLIDTALRETQEEIGISVERTQVLGLLSELYIPPSNMQVTPVVAYQSELPVYRPDPSEVDAVFDTAIEALSDTQNRTVTQVQVAGRNWMEAPAFQAEGKIIWGATAMILSELLEVLREVA